MFEREDTTYHDIQERSLQQWLEELAGHEDVAVRGGVKLCREYIDFLKERNRKLQEENELKNRYLKQLSKRA